MWDELKAAIEGLGAYRELRKGLEAEGAHVPVAGLYGSARSLVLGRLAAQQGLTYLVIAPDPVRARDIVVRLCLERIPQAFGLDGLRDVQVLTPMHRGPIGAGQLNAALQAALNPPRNGATELLRGGRIFRVGDRVLQLRNNYDKGVYNGETVVPEEPLDVPPDTEIGLLVPGRSANAFADLLEELDRLPPLPPDEVLSEEEIVALVHEVRAEMRAKGE